MAANAYRSPFLLRRLVLRLRCGRRLTLLRSGRWLRRLRRWWGELRRRLRRSRSLLNALRILRRRMGRNHRCVRRWLIAQRVLDARLRLHLSLRLGVRPQHLLLLAGEPRRLLLLLYERRILLRTVIPGCSGLRWGRRSRHRLGLALLCQESPALRSPSSLNTSANVTSSRRRPLTRCYRRR